MPRQVSPAKAWCFTLNNYTDSEYEFLSSIDSSKYWYIIGKEIGDGGTPHLQGYFGTKSGKKFRPLPAFGVYRQGNNGSTQCVHFERSKGTRDHNRAYCSKDGKFITNIPRVKRVPSLHEQLIQVESQILELTKRKNIASELELGDDELLYWAGRLDIAYGKRLRIEEGPSCTL